MVSRAIETEQTCRTLESWDAKKNTFMLIIDSKLKKHCEEVPDLIHAEVDSVIGLGMSREGFFSWNKGFRVSGKLLIFRRNAIIAYIYVLMVDDMEKCLKQTWI